MKVSDIQKALAAHGINPGPIDGIWGRQTIAAVREFQRRSNLEVDGIVGPMTLGALFPNTPKYTGLDQVDLVWFKEARRLIGTKEKPGTGSNPEILDWASDAGIPYDSDDTPWCGLFVAHCIGSTLDREPIPTAPLWARAWRRFGYKTEPTTGAVMVFWRESRGSSKGHVGFYAGEDASAYRILGGNQSDSVSLAWIKKDRLLEARWPSTAAAVIPTAVEVARRDTLSWDEA
ncbi:TIGR02594 family protein [Aurantimonas sp. 22II-16-19i]|uniref:NlpC/P60 family protein n=1 Tax=Aurantimonas sp. 22II-16-19i TaxID=1317114 RepID=UPI0009F7FAC0|nr:TIGR02594 family protein [Aurantimonas sp. 22II-16-19i]ORE98642.1 hypothetical protein ATO4_03980 [Aurantimonas sp. 22II-16-19i]